VDSRQHVAALVDDLSKTLSGFEDPVREARELIAALLDVPRHWPLFHENRWVDANVWQRAHAAAQRRVRGAPLAYAVRRANFRSLTLDVDERVLIPRPETERLVDLVLERCAGGTIVDVGTGTGAIAISLALEGKFDRVIATDVSRDALDVARANAARYDATIELRLSSLLAGVPPERDLDVVVSNPPYISLAEAGGLPASVRDWEPAVALFSGPDGLHHTARLVRQAGTRLATGGLLALEVDSRRASLVAELLASDSRYENVTMMLDYSGRERFVLATRRRTND
jgi:release factor glutamine methyltransferase